jgi:hypothetical protein
MGTSAVGVGQFAKTPAQNSNFISDLLAGHHSKIGELVTGYSLQHQPIKPCGERRRVLG